jgi:hypothetical protein
MTMRTTVPIASRRAFVGLEAAAALSASAIVATPPGVASVPAPRKVVRCQSSGRIGQQAKMRKCCYRCAVAEQAAAKTLLGRDSRAP